SVITYHEKGIFAFNPITDSMREISLDEHKGMNILMQNRIRLNQEGAKNSSEQSLNRLVASVVLANDGSKIADEKFSERVEIASNSFGVMALFAPVAYLIDTGGLHRLSFIPVTEEEFTRWDVEHVKNAAMFQAEQLGTAMQLFGMDNDDRYPGARDWQEKLFPYTKDRTLFENFTYLLDGQSYGQIKDPSETVVG